MEAEGHGLLLAHRHQASVFNTPADLPTSATYTLTREQPISRSTTFLRHSFGQTFHTKHRNINLLSIDYAFRPRLRFRLTLGGFTWPRNPWIYGGRDSRPPYRYSFQHQLLWDLQRSLRYAFISTHNALLPLKKSIASVRHLSPVTFSAQNH